MFKFFLIRWKLNRISPEQIVALAEAAILTPIEKEIILNTPRLSL